MSTERRTATSPRTGSDRGGAEANGAAGTVPQTPRRRMSAADRRAQLLDIVRDIVAAEGFAAVSIDRVARAAHVARALVYQQFTDLSGLMAALLDRESGIAMAGIGTIDQVEDLDQVSRGILAYLQAAPTSWRIMLSPPDGGPPDLRDRLEAGRTFARAIATRHLSRYTGVTVDPDGATQRIMLAAIEELARLHLADPGNYPDDLVLRYLRALMLWSAGMESPRLD